VNLYTWNRVSVYRVNQLGGLSVNGGRPVHGHSSGQLTELNLPMSVYVGGYAPDYNRQARLTSGFHGAIQRVRFFCRATLGKSAVSVRKASYRRSGRSRYRPIGTAA